MSRLKCLMSLMLLMGGGFTMAQTSRNSMMVGGAAELTVTAEGKERLFRLGMSPSFGYFVLDNFAVGASYNLLVSNSKSQKLFQITSGVSPLLRYFIGKKQLKGLIHTSAGYAGTIYANDGNTGSRDQFTSRIAAGMVYFIQNRLGIETTFGWNLTAAKNRIPVSRIGFQLGLQVYLSPVKKLKHSLDVDSTPGNE